MKKWGLAASRRRGLSKARPPAASRPKFRRSMLLADGKIASQESATSVMRWAYTMKIRHIVGAARGDLSQVMPNFRQQLARAKRFRHIVIAARRTRLLFFAAEHIGGDRDDAHRRTSCKPVSVHAAQSGFMWLLTTRPSVPSRLNSDTSHLAGNRQTEVRYA
jgi:hypothetical protein